MLLELVRMSRVEHLSLHIYDKEIAILNDGSVKS